MKKRTVLFLCTGNSARSQMAEGLLKWHAGDRFDVHSAGLRPSVLHPLAVTAMDEMGIDIRNQHAKGVKDLAGVRFFFVIIVCASREAECPQTFSKGAVLLEWPFEDPAHEMIPEPSRLHRFRRVRDQINETIRRWLEKELPASW